MDTKDYQQLFRLSPEIWNAMTFEDVMATYSDMVDLNIAQTPYANFAVEVKLKFLKQMVANPESFPPHMGDNIIFLEYDFKWAEFRGKIVDSPQTIYITLITKDGKIQHPREEIIASLGEEKRKLSKEKSEKYELFEDFLKIAFDVNMVLTVILATKNVEKSVKLDKNLVAKKFNKKNAYRKNYPSTTSIRIGSITETCANKNDDPRFLRPHLRRGHVRRQHYGPNNEMIKQIFIAPVFVNASEGWIAERKAYNVSLAA